MLNQHEIDIIQRFLAGKATASESEWIENLFAEGKTNSGLNKHLQGDWENTETTEQLNLTYLLDRVHHAIRLKEQEKRKSYSFRFIHIYSRVAAILLLPVLAGGLWLWILQLAEPEQLAEQPATTSIYTPMGSRVAFNLPDGTTGYLNSGSTLTYTIPFASNRSVELQGEAWFDVAHDEQHPFEIVTGTSAVRVLGTSFNLSAYPDEIYVEVVLAEGSVEFSPAPHVRPVQLHPSERLVYNGQSILVEKTETVKYSGWTKGKLIFRGDNMAEVARRLERWYNIEIEIADKALEGYIFRGTFEDDSLQEVLRLLSMTSPIKYSITPRRLTSGDTWSKEKVTLFLRKS